MRGANLTWLRLVGECSDCTHAGLKTRSSSGGNLSGLKVVPACPVSGLTKASSCHKGAGCTKTQDEKEKERCATCISSWVVSYLHTQ